MKIPDDLSPRNFNARKLAYVAHGTQKYGDKPYLFHLDSVVQVLFEFGYGDNPDLIDAGFLHDVLEDTSYGVMDMAKWQISPYTIALVDAVTAQPGINRKERFERTYPRIRRMSDAIILKLADRIANVREKTKNDMYLKEYPKFRGELRTLCLPLENKEWRMWMHLDDLLLGDD